MASDSPDSMIPQDTDGSPALEPEIDGEGWSGAEIDEAYLKALHAMEDIPWEEGLTTLEGPAGPADSAAPANFIRHEGPAAAIAPTAAAENLLAEPGSVAPGQAGVAEGPATDRCDSVETVARLAKGTQRSPSLASDEHLNVSVPQVIEAALFVGGGALTAKKICALLRGSFETAFVEQTIDELNDAYVAQARPYEIRLGDGGYRLELRSDYDRLRHRVYGSGPREVRLSQDILEVLALVAYQQPISQNEIESHGKQNAGNLLRQLLRRDLIAIDRGSGGRKNVQYHTTDRFLSVFGLGSLDELPQAEDVAKK